MIRPISLAFAGLTAFATTNAQTTYGLQGTSPTSGPYQYSNYNGTLGGIQFQTGSQTTYLDSVSWWGLSPSPNSSYTVSLYTEGTDSSYGTLIGILGTTNTSQAFTNTYLTIVPPVDFELGANTNYWIGFQSSGWMAIQPVSSMPYTYGSDFGWNVTSTYNIGVDGNGAPIPYAMNIAASIVPEASSSLLSLLGCSSLMLRRNRRA